MKINFDLIIGFLSGMDPELDQFAADLKAAEADGKIDTSEIETLVADALKVAEGRWGKGAALCEDAVAAIRLGDKIAQDIKAYNAPPATS